MTEQIQNLILFLISWGPTIIFSILIGFGAILGLSRGLKRTFRFFLRGVVFALFALVLYFTLIAIPQMNEKLFELTNLILGLFEIDLLNAFGITENVTNFVDFFIAIIPKMTGYGNVISSMIVDNTEYIRALAVMGYHVMVALLAILFYCIELLISEIIIIVYKFCNIVIPKDGYNYMTSIDDGKPRRFFGLLLGTVRGCISSILIISLIGTLYFIGSGGSKEEKLPELKFSDPQINFAYDAYRAFEDYGNKGVFKVLNNLKDKDNIPYYVYAFDMVFQGNYVSPNTSTKENIYLREETEAYVSFSKSTFNLLLKYDQDGKLKEYIEKLGNTETKPEEIAMAIITNPDFIDDFEKEIVRLEDNTFVFNMSLAMINSLLSKNNLNISAEAQDIINILFKGENPIYLNDILDIADIKVILRGVLNIMAVSEQNKNESEKTITPYAMSTLDMLENLSLLNDKGKVDKISGALTNCYNYLVEKSLSQVLGLKKSAINENTDENRIKSINWFSEIRRLKSVIKNVSYIYDNVYLSFKKERPDATIFDFITKYYFNYGVQSEQRARYENLLNIFSESEILAGVLSSSTLYNKLSQQILGGVQLRYPNNIRFSNVYNENDELVSYGEIYYIFKIVQIVANDVDLLKTIEELKNIDSSKDNLENINKMISLLDNKENIYNLSILDLMTRSELLSYTLTNAINEIKLNVSGTECNLYLAKQSLDEIIYENEKYFKLKSNYLYQTIKDLPVILDIFKNLENADLEAILDAVVNSELGRIINENIVIEGLASGIVLETLKTIPYVNLTTSLLDVEEWLRTDKENGEIFKIISALKETGFNLNDLANGNITIETVKGWNLTRPKLENLMSSKVLYFIISGFLNDNSDLGIVVPYDALDLSYNEKDENGNAVGIIKKNEIFTLFTNILEILDGDYINIQRLFQNKNSLLESKIFEATAINFLIKELKNNDLIVIPRDYLSAADPIKLKEEDNIWFVNGEVSNILNSLDALFNIQNEGFDINDINENKIAEIINSLLEPYNQNNPGETKLDIIYKSAIMSATLSNSLDMVLTEDIVSREALNVIKETEAYTKNEIEQLVRGVQTLDLNLNNINMEKIISQIKSLNDKYIANKTKLDVIYESKILALVITKQIDKQLEILNINSNVVKGSKSYSNSNIPLEFHIEEIAAIIDVLKLLNIDFDKLDSIDILEIIKSLNDRVSISETKLDIIYKSNLMASLVTDKLDEIVESQPLLATTPAAKEKRKGIDYLFYKNNEISVLIDILIQEQLNLDSFNVNALDLIRLKGYIKKSNILLATFTKQVANIDELVLPKKSLDENKLIKQDEIDSLFKLFFEINLVNLGSTIKLVLTDSIIDLALTSDLLKASISNIILNLDIFTIPNTVLETGFDYNNHSIKVLNNIEFKKFLNGLTKSFDLRDIQNLNSGSLKMPSKENISVALDSEILSNTISNKIIKASTGLYVSNDDKYSKMIIDSNNNKTLVFTNAELMSIVDILYLLGIEDFNLSISLSSFKGLSSADKDSILKSNVMHIFISNLVIDALPFIGIDMNINRIICYKLGFTNNIITLKVLKKDIILNALNMIK